MIQLNSILNQLRPFIVVVALLFGLIAAWQALSDLLPFLRQVWAPRGSAQSNAIVAAALAIVGGNR